MDDMDNNNLNDDNDANIGCNGVGQENNDEQMQNGSYRSDEDNEMDDINNNNNLNHNSNDDEL